jgi:hypothetical protein
VQLPLVLLRKHLKLLLLLQPRWLKQILLLLLRLLEEWQVQTLTLWQMLLGQ